jgi:hypothetical protein
MVSSAAEPSAAGNGQASGDYATRADDRALIEMGIDPEDNDLSPAAMAAIARAHRAAQEAGEAASPGEEAPATTDSGGDENVNEAETPAANSVEPQAE